jgi:hypothetical protein
LGLVQWRKRKQGSPRQIGQAFPLDESQQKKKGLLDRLRGRFAGHHEGVHEHEYVERLRELIHEHTESGEERLADGILTEADAEYLEKRGLITIDPMTEDISLTEQGQIYMLGERAKQKKKMVKSLTEFEKDMILEKRARYDEENERK